MGRSYRIVKRYRKNDIEYQSFVKRHSSIDFKTYSDDSFFSDFDGDGSRSVDLKNSFTREEMAEVVRDIYFQDDKDISIIKHKLQSPLSSLSVVGDQVGLSKQAVGARINKIVSRCPALSAILKNVEPIGGINRKKVLPEG